MIGCIGWAAPARLVRAAVIEARGARYVLAQRAFGFPATEIFASTLLPRSLMSAVLSLAYFVPELIGIEVGLVVLWPRRSAAHPDARSAHLRRPRRVSDSVVAVARPHGCPAGTHHRHRHLHPRVAATHPEELLMTPIRTSQDSTIASARVYQIHAATELLNQTIKETWPQAESERPFSRFSNLQFIERSWFKPERSLHFKFTYFRVSNFYDKADAILGAIDQQRTHWRALLEAVNAYVQERPSLRTRLNKTIKFFSTLLDGSNSSNMDPGELHYRFADLQASLPVDNYMPGALWELHVKPTHSDCQPWCAYHVLYPKDNDLPATTLPRLTVVPRPLQPQSDSPGTTDTTLGTTPYHEGRAIAVDLALAPPWSRAGVF